MEKEFVPYAESLELKELGFDEHCFGFFNYKGSIRRYTNFDGELNDFQTLKNSSITMGNEWCAAPTFSQSFRWFREKYELMGHVEKGYRPTNYYPIIHLILQKESHKYNPSLWFNTYEEAELACLRKLIEIVKTKIQFLPEKQKP